MAADSMKIRLFVAKCDRGKMARVLRKAQDLVREDDIAALNMPIGSNEHIRITDVSRRGPLWLMNFAHGKEGASPIKFSPERKVEEVEYAPDQMPGEEAAVLYTPETNHFLIQQVGRFKMNPIRIYLNWIGEEQLLDLDLDPEVNQETDIAFRKGGEFSRLEFRVDLQTLTSLGLENHIPLEQGLDDLNESSAHRVEVAYIADRGENLNKNFVLSIGRKLLSILRKEEKNKDTKSALAVSKLKARGKIVGDPDEKAQLFDFVSRLVEEEVRMSLKRHRFPLPERYHALVSTYEKWKIMLEQMRRPPQNP